MSSVTVSHVCHYASFPLSPLYIYVAVFHVHCHLYYVMSSVTVRHALCHCASHPPETCWVRPRRAVARPLPSSSQQSSCCTSYPSCLGMVGGAGDGGWGWGWWAGLGSVHERGISVVVRYQPLLGHGTSSLSALTYVGML